MFLCWWFRNSGTCTYNDEDDTVAIMRLVLYDEEDTTAIIYYGTLEQTDIIKNDKEIDVYIYSPIYWIFY